MEGKNTQTATIFCGFPRYRATIGAAGKPRKIRRRGKNYSHLLRASENCRRLFDVHLPLRFCWYRRRINNTRNFVHSKNFRGKTFVYYLVRTQMRLVLVEIFPCVYVCADFLFYLAHRLRCFLSASNIVHYELFIDHLHIERMEYNKNRDVSFARTDFFWIINTCNNNKHNRNNKHTRSVNLYVNISCVGSHV